MGEPTLDVEKAYHFYQAYLLRPTQAKAVIYEEYGFAVVGTIVPRDWEVFTAILLRDRAKPGYGADLERHEVKSALYGGNFEYQYHRHHGEQKLEEDRQLDHVFVAYTKDYLALEVWFVLGQVLTPLFDSWLPGLQANYQGDAPRQRYRRSIPFGIVKQHGTMLLKISEGVLVWPPSI